MHESANYLTPHQHLVLSIFFFLAILCVVEFHTGFNLHFLMTNDAKCFFPMLIATQTSSWSEGYCLF